MNKSKSKKALESTNWNEALGTHWNEPNISFCLLLKTVSFTLEKYTPLTQITKKMQKTSNKRCLTKALLHQLTAKNIYIKVVQSKRPK